MSVMELNGSNFAEEIKEGITLVDFWAPWCGPCKILGNVIEELAEELGDEVKIGKVNIDDNQELALKFNVMSIPTLIIFKDGEPANQTVGVVSKKAIKDKINAAK